MADCVAISRPTAIGGGSAGYAIYQPFAGDAAAATSAFAAAAAAQLAPRSTPDKGIAAGQSLQALRTAGTDLTSIDLRSALSPSAVRSPTKYTASPIDSAVGQAVPFPAPGSGRRRSPVGATPPSPYRTRPGVRRFPIRVAMASTEEASHAAELDKDDANTTTTIDAEDTQKSADTMTELTPAPITDASTQDPAPASEETIATNVEAGQHEKEEHDALKVDPQLTSSNSHPDESSEATPIAHSRPNTSRPQSRTGSVSPRRQSQPSPTRVLRGLSGEFPVSHPPPPSTADRMAALDQRSSTDRLTSPPPPAGMVRKASSGFGALLGRMGRKAAQSPPASRPQTGTGERRNTGTSTASAESGAGNGLSMIPDGPEFRTASLQDQFTHLRLQQEFPADALGPGDAEAEDKQGGAHVEPPAVLSPGSSALKSPPLNPSLPPGTAAGVSAGPAELPREVDWDLWQQVVYDGPAAVTRSSGAELSQAIASGIPPAIRGVVWQVLAESKNVELEHIYRTLKARGTEAEVRPGGSRSGSAAALNSTTPGASDAAESDASSIHSEHSTPAPTPAAAAGDRRNSSELHGKLLAEKQKREAAALQKLERAIKRDLGSRTSYSKYAQAAGLQDGLFGVCKAYALFDEGVGYAQGINFVAMPLLFNLGEEEAFTLLVRLMSKYELRSLFTAEMRGLHCRLYQFERLLEDREPAVYCHLRRRGVSPTLYATQWFLTLFAYRFPLQLVLRVYDLIFSEGLTAILKFGLVLMQRNRAALLAMNDMSQLTTFLKEKIFDVYIDKSPSASSLLDSGFFGSVSGGADKELYRADEMVADACEITIPETLLARYTVEWEESQKIERDREHELETLKMSNGALNARVRSLEERVQQNDTEHVGMAQDLVRLKVENDALLDTNEGLKLQVVELQKLLDTQPAEVEQKLKTEMDRIMQRNIEVQNENRHLREEMDEMEHALVNVKMLHAQAQTDHDTLKQKWSSVQALLNDKS